MFPRNVRRYQDGSRITLRGLFQILKTICSYGIRRGIAVLTVLIRVFEPAISVVDVRLRTFALRNVPLHLSLNGIFGLHAGILSRGAFNANCWGLRVSSFAGAGYAGLRRDVSARCGEFVEFRWFIFLLAIVASLRLPHSTKRVPRL